jgi:two-component system response regulator GlrR
MQAAVKKDSLKRKAKILVVDDDPGLLRLLTIRLRAENYEVEAVQSAADALVSAAAFRPDLVVTDLRMDQMDGIGLLKELQSRWPGLKVIILTAHGTIPDAVRATQSGAFGFLTKPVEKQELLEHVQKALKISGFPAVDEEWRADIVTRSPVMEEKLQQAHMAAGTDARVLITGEGGVGKKLLAHAIHRAGSRREGPFVVVSCAELTEPGLDAALFGPHSAEGTIVLDEIAELPAPLQLKLVRVLQEGRTPGGTPPLRPSRASSRRPATTSRSRCCRASSARTCTTD